MESPWLLLSRIQTSRVKGCDSRGRRLWFVLDSEITSPSADPTLARCPSSRPSCDELTSPEELKTGLYIGDNVPVRANRNFGTLLPRSGVVDGEGSAALTTHKRQPSARALREGAVVCAQEARQNQIFPCGAHSDIVWGGAVSNVWL